MASEPAAARGTRPAAPATRRKSRKTGRATPAAGGAAREGGEAAAAEIEGLTRAGRRALALGDARAAVGCFRQAFLLSGGTASPRLHRVCAFNLGAAYVESGKPEKALGFLLRSQPSEGDGGERSGDLYFNVGAAHEGLRDFPKALEYFGKAAGGDRAAQAGSRAGARVQMGCCYLGMREPARAARCFLDAAQSYAAAASPEAAAVALSRASGSMLQSRRFAAPEIAGVLARCRSLCESIPDPALRGKLYNDIGLGYCQLRVFSLATESFERALALRGSELDRRGEAALLQNLGAAHNARRSFGTALGWHRRAAALHGTLGNRRAQGQCFGNLAYACSRLGDHEAAAENYLHALQAFRDSGDVPGQWQACEGLGAAHFRLGDPRRAIGHYQEALALLSRCPDTPQATRQRVVRELADAIRHQLCLSHGRVWAPAPAPLSVAAGTDTTGWVGGKRLRGLGGRGTGARRPPAGPLSPPDPRQLPHASGTRLRRSEGIVREINLPPAEPRFFGGEAQPGDELCAPLPPPRPRRSGTGAAPADSSAPEPRDLETSGEDEDGRGHRTQLELRSAGEPRAAALTWRSPRRRDRRASSPARTSSPSPAPQTGQQIRGSLIPLRNPRLPTPRNASVVSLPPSLAAGCRPCAGSGPLSTVCSLL
ncbi:tetratricopeptide repeat protein 24 [Opisthocomus hoazin]|uniref:tetratricopeptide repeat protein 24 n=1 Tax=Opisthocomus hoazin TaxID=30419 RepID=UPI003F52ED1A